jgi:hypothetical protein
MKVGSYFHVASQLTKIQENYFAEIKKLEEECATSQDTCLLSSLKQLAINFNFIKSLNELKVKKDHKNIAKICIFLLDQFYATFVDTIDRKKNNKIDDRTKVRAQIDEIKNTMLLELSVKINDMAAFSMNFCNAFMQYNGLDIVFKYFTNQMLVDYYVETHSLGDDFKVWFEMLDAVLRNILGDFILLSRGYSAYKPEWKKHNAMKVFLNHLDKTKDVLNNKVFTSTVIAFIADDEDVNELTHLKEVIPDLIELLVGCAECFEEGKDIFRESFALDESEVFKDIAEVDKNGDLWNLVNIIEALYHLSVIDTLKSDIYFKFNAVKYLKVIIFRGNEVEKEYSILMLWQLSFDKGVAHDLLKHTELLDYLNRLSSDDKLDKNLVNNATGLLWNLSKSDKSRRGEDINKQILLQDDFYEKHIMKSFNKKTRDLCVKLKRELEKEMKKTWSDSED